MAIHTGEMSLTQEVLSLASGSYQLDHMEENTTLKPRSTGDKIFTNSVAKPFVWGLSQLFPQAGLGLAKGEVPGATILEAGLMAFLKLNGGLIIVNQGQAFANYSHLPAAVVGVAEGLVAGIGNFSINVVENAAIVGGRELLRRTNNRFGTVQRSRLKG